MDKLVTVEWIGRGSRELWDRTHVGQLGEDGKPVAEQPETRKVTEAMARELMARDKITGQKNWKLAGGSKQTRPKPGGGDA